MPSSLQECINEYYVKSLGPRLDALLAQGRITPEVHRDFALRVENARNGGARPAPDTQAQAHSVGGVTTPLPTL